MERTKRAAHSVDPAVIEANSEGNLQRCIFAKTLNYLLESNGIDQEKMADDLKLSEGAIHNYRTGKTDPKLTALVKIAEYLNVDCDFLMRGVESKHTDVAKLGLTNDSIERMLWLNTGTWKRRINAFNLLINTRGFIFSLDYLDQIGRLCEDISKFEKEYQQQVDDALSSDDQEGAFAAVEALLGKASDLKQELRYSVFELSESIKDSAREMCGYDESFRLIDLIGEKIFNDMHEDFDEATLVKML